MAHLLIRLESGERFFSQLVGTRTNLGSGGWEQDVRISIAHPSVALLHASIEGSEGDYHLFDRSGGRTWHRGQVATGEKVFHRDDFKLGDVYATFYEDEIDAGDPSTALEPADPEQRPLPEKLWLVVKIPGRHEPQRVPIQPGAKLVLGSGPGVGLRFPHPTVSERHGVLTREESHLTLADESRNGTFVNGVRIGSCRLRLGMPFRIGPYPMHVEAEIEERPGLIEFRGIFTADRGMKEVFALVERIAQIDRTVVVTGESGTGKEGIARALHALSLRSGGPFIAQNCGALPELLAEAELFGAAKGAYTGSVAARDGLFVQAHGGTLFLDEVGELSHENQKKLLRVLETGEVRALGSNKTLKVDVRVVAATHRDLRKAVEDGTFREDLYFRLFVLTVELPPLRDRGEDAVLLFQHFAKLALPREAVPAPTEAAKELLRLHPWRGNVRELKNVAERAVFTARLDQPLGPEALHLRAPPRLAPPGAPGSIHVRGRNLEEVEKLAIALAMRDHLGNRKTAAEQLGISATTLLKKLREYGLEAEGKG